jgi:hypothetical protein
MLRKELIRDGTLRIIGSAIYARVSACLWVVGGLLFSFAAEGAVVLFTGNVYILPVGTFSPVPLAALWCSRG